MSFNFENCFFSSSGPIKLDTDGERTEHGTLVLHDKGACGYLGPLCTVEPNINIQCS